MTYLQFVCSCAIRHVLRGLQTCCQCLIFCASLLRHAPICFFFRPRCDHFCGNGSDVIQMLSFSSQRPADPLELLLEKVYSSCWLHPTSWNENAGLIDEAISERS